MHQITSLRIARAHSSIRSHGPWSYTLAPHVIGISRSPKRLGPSLRRPASTAPQAKAQEELSPKSAAELVSSPARPSSLLPASALLNPPASTRPPPLELPTRDPKSSLFTYLFHLGRAYTTFYKTGLRAIFVNRRLLSQSGSTPPSPTISGATTFPSRSDILLRSRVRHDLSRLPIFGLLVLICGEFTPLIVLVFPRLTPYTCRIPKQTDALRRAAEARRAASFRALRYQVPDGPQASPDISNGHICRSLGLTSALWDKIGFDGPFAAVLAQRAIARIAADDAMIREGGGEAALVNDEVVLACEDRGINIRGESTENLRSQLKEWLCRTAASSREEAEEKVRTALLGLDGKA